MALTHANQNEQERGGLPFVVSKGDSAWRLTAEGVAFVRENAPRIEAATGRARPAPSKSSPSSRRVREIRNHPAYVKFVRGSPVGDLARHEIADLLLCPPDASARSVQRKVDAAKAAAVDVGDEDLRGFLESVGKEVDQKWS